MVSPEAYPVRIDDCGVMAANLSVLVIPLIFHAA